MYKNLDNAHIFLVPRLKLHYGNERECLTKYTLRFPEGGFERNFKDSQRSHVYLPNETHPSVCPLKTPFKNSLPLLKL